MPTKKKIKEFKNLEKFPDLQQALVASFKTMPIGSMNIKVIINKGEIVERVYRTPNGEIISHFPNIINEQASKKEEQTE